MIKKLILFPFGGNAREAATVVEGINRVRREWDLIGFVDDDTNLRGRGCCGAKVLGGREFLRQNPDVFVLAVIGSPGNYLRRKSIIDGLMLEPSRFAQIVHPSVTMSSEVKVGYDTLIMPNVVLTANVVIGNHCIILSNTTVSHDVVIGDYCCIGSNVSVSGSVVIGENCYVGSGTAVRDGITIGERSLVGLGSNVVKNIGEGNVVAGNPARFMRRAI